MTILRKVKGLVAAGCLLLATAIMLASCGTAARHGSGVDARERDENVDAGVLNGDASGAEASASEYVDGDVGNAQDANPLGFDEPIVGDAGPWDVGVTFDAGNSTMDTTVGDEFVSGKDGGLSEENQSDGASFGGGNPPCEFPRCDFVDPSDYVDVNVRIAVVSGVTGEAIVPEGIAWYYNNSEACRAERYPAQCADAKCTVWQITAPACGPIVVVGDFVGDEVTPGWWFYGIGSVRVDADPTVFQDTTLSLVSTAVIHREALDDLRASSIH
jgi:hypothetical protein